MRFWGAGSEKIAKPQDFVVFGLVSPAAPLIDPSVETWPSGRRRAPAKGVGGKLSRGFESLRLRHPPFSFSSVGAHSTPYGAVFVSLTAFIFAFDLSSITLVSIHCVV